jgi:hypothetical protein
MSADFNEVLVYLEEKGVGMPDVPRVIVEGGKKPLSDLDNRLFTNSQVIISVHQLPTSDDTTARETKDRIKRHFEMDGEIGSFTFDSREELEEILDQLADQFQQNIDNNEVIHSFKGYGSQPTKFVMLLPVIDSNYYD